MSFPSVSEVEQIVNNVNPVMRNLNITMGYYELSEGMKKITGESSNWCTYAVWASKQAGQSIRKEELIRTFEYYFHNSPEVISLLEDLQKLFKNLNELPEIKSIKESILGIVNPDAVFEKTAGAVAAGNKKVFGEIGMEFARFLQFYSAEGDLNPKNINIFCERFKPGNPPEGQQFLKDAFASYAEAYHEEDPKAKTELIHYANILIALHEQQQVQPQILEALDAPIDDADDIRKQVFKLIMPGLWLKIRYFLSRVFMIKFPLDEILDSILDLLKKFAREVITRYMMSLTIPGTAEIRLGNDLNMNFPPLLQHLANKNLINLLAKIDPSIDSLKDSGAIDWGDLNDRIHFIADYFRCYIAYQPLYSTPFTDEQMLLIKSGKLP